MTDLDPAHVEAVVNVIDKATHDLGVGYMESEAVAAIAKAILTSTDPAVHAALLATLVRAGVLRPKYDPGIKGMREFPDRRCYVTRWEDVDE